MARRVGRSQWAQETIGFGCSRRYLRLVQRTSRFTTVPEDLDAFIKGELPLIAAMWHGQHLMMPLARPKTMDRLAVLISRHEDAGAQALAAERLDITPVRGSGGPADRVYYKGGASAMRELMRQLESGVSVAMTADVPKRARVAGHGNCRAGQAVGPSHRPDRGGVEPARSVPHLGSRHARIAVRPRGGHRRRFHPRFGRRRRGGDGGRPARRRARARRGAPAGLRHGWSERRQIRESFEQTFTAAAENFERLAEQLFPGGRGRLRLVREDSGPRPVLGGAEVPAQDPHGRRGDRGGG